MPRETERDTTPNPYPNVYPNAYPNVYPTLPLNITDTFKDKTKLYRIQKIKEIKSQILRK